MKRAVAVGAPRAERTAVFMLMVFLLALALLVTPALAAGPGPQGSDGAGAEFGGHVADHAQTMGFSEEMNPGMHQGFHGHEMHMHD